MASASDSEVEVMERPRSQPRLMKIFLRAGCGQRGRKVLEALKVLDGKLMEVNPTTSWKVAIWNKFKFRLDADKYSVRATTSTRHNVLEPIKEILPEFNENQGIYNVRILKGKGEKVNILGTTPKPRPAPADGRRKQMHHKRTYGLMTGAAARGGQGFAGGPSSSAAVRMRGGELRMPMPLRRQEGVEAVGRGFDLDEAHHPRRRNPPSFLRDYQTDHDDDAHTEGTMHSLLAPQQQRSAKCAKWVIKGTAGADQGGDSPNPDIQMNENLTDEDGDTRDQTIIEDIRSQGSTADLNERGIQMYTIKPKFLANANTLGNSELLMVQKDYKDMKTRPQELKRYKMKYPRFAIFMETLFDAMP